MAPNAGHLWELLLQQLHKLQGSVAAALRPEMPSPGAITASQDTINKLLDSVQQLAGKISALPRLSDTTWAGLVQKQQVCHAI